MRRRLEPAYWLIEKIEDGSMEVLTVHLGGGRRALSVFSHREEAEMFFWLGSLTDGWRVKKSRGRELVQKLLGPHASIGFVALDPLPEMVAERTVDLVSLPRERFTEYLTAGGGSGAARGSNQRTKPEGGAGYGAVVP